MAYEGKFSLKIFMDKKCTEETEYIEKLIKTISVKI